MMKMESIMNGPRFLIKGRLALRFKIHSFVKVFLSNQFIQNLFPEGGGANILVSRFDISEIWQA